MARPDFLIDERWTGDNGAKGSTPFYDAVSNDRLAMAKTLLECGADVEGKTAACEVTPLALAASRLSGKEMMVLLLHYKAEVNRHGLNGDTALHYAIKSGSACNVRLLLDNGADINARNNEGISPLDLHREMLKWNLDNPNSMIKDSEGSVIPSEEMQMFLDGGITLELAGNQMRLR